jgi:methionyl aminopeptidase
VAGKVLDEIAAFIKPGVTTRQVDEFCGGADQELRREERVSGYRKYPCHTCMSVNDEVVHGMASERELKFGDIVSVDVGVFTKVLSVTRRGRWRWAVAACGAAVDGRDGAVALSGHRAGEAGKPGADISRAVQQYVEGNGFSVVREFVGHGVGRTMHEEPQVPNFVDRQEELAEAEAGHDDCD